MNIARYRYVYLGIATVLTLAAIGCIVVYKFHPGIEFTGGGLWDVTVTDNAPNADALRATLQSAVGEGVQVTPTGDAPNRFLVRFGGSNPEAYNEVRAATAAAYGSFEEHSFQSIGPSVSGALRRNAVLAIIFVLLAISLYIVFAFRKASGPVRPWAYGLATLLTLFHDVAIPAGMLAVLGHYGKVEIDTNFVVALLVVMGFSVHDTIVVFDRIRETLIRNADKKAFTEVVNQSVRQTVARSINTSLTLVLVLIALLAVGPETLHYFVLTLLVGVSAGAYSSIFVASPLLLLLARFSRKQGTTKGLTRRPS